MDLEEAELRIDACKVYGWKELDLSGLRLSELPSSLWELKGLRELRLSGNYLVSLPDKISKFTELESLFLFDNELVTLSDAISELSNLKTLSLNSNELFDVPPGLEKLTKLTRLFLGNNSLASLPPWLGKMVSLRKLNASDNQIESVPSSIGDLENLEQLSLTSNRISALPDSIGKLKKLAWLLLERNLLAEIPESLGQLGSLTDLTLGHNHLTSLPGSLKSLRSLNDISINDNRLTEFPSFLVQLTSLRSLLIQNNQLQNLPASIGQLTELEKLDLSNNNLRHLPKSLLSLTKLRYLFLHGNLGLGLTDEVLGPPQDMLHTTPQRVKPKQILSFYFETLTNGASLNEVKLLLVGRGGVGKTSISRRLTEKGFNSRQKETEGITISPWRVQCKPGSVHVHMWDFAGQVITHATHQFFLTSRSIYVLVLTGRENSERADADYWLRLIRAFATERTRAGEGGADSTNNFELTTAPVIIVLNKWKNAPSRLDRNALVEKYPFIVGFVETDCETAYGIKNLKRQIVKTIDDMESVRQNFPAAWLGIKSELSQSKTHYIKYSEYQELCGKHGEADPERQMTLSRVMHNLGIALNYADDQRLKDTTVLNPHWVTNGIYKLLRDATHSRRSEEMWLADAKRTLPEESDEMRRYLIELMRRFELAFPIAEKGDGWIVPQRLSESQPKLGREWFDGDVTRVRYSYAALPEGLLPRFITRTYPLSEEQPRWVNGVLLDDDGARALVRADQEERQITISVIGQTESRAGLTAMICEELDRIHDDIKGLDQTHEVELAQNPGVWVRVDSLKADERGRKSSATDSAVGSIEFSNTEELNRISNPFARNPNNMRLKVFISYSKQDARQRDALLVRLKRLRADGLVDTWNDRDLRPGEQWNDEIKVRLESADVVLCLVSAAFEATDYIQNIEIPIACQRAAKGRCLVVPIILENCDWQNGPLQKYTALPPKAKPIRNTNPQRDAWYVVQQELRVLFQNLLKEHLSLLK